VAYRDDAADVLEAPTAEGPLRIELGPRAVKLTVATRTLYIVDKVATVIEHRKAKQGRRRSLRIEGRLTTARDVPHEDLGIWLELEPSGGRRAGMQRIFGVEPVSLLEPDGLPALAALDRVATWLRGALAELGGDIQRAVEIGRGLDKVLLADHGDRFVLYARRLFRDRARFAAEIHTDGRIVIPDGKRRHELHLRSRFGVTVVGDYIRFADPEGVDLARISIPWIGPEDRLELARRIGQLVDPTAAIPQRTTAGDRSR
jgi:hypothetical protein